jgi:hypothetical protein
MIITNTDFKALDDLQKAFADKRVLNLNIHEQDYFRIHDTTRGSKEESLVLKQADQTHACNVQLDDCNVPTLEIQYDIVEYNKAWAVASKGKIDVSSPLNYYPNRFFEYNKKTFTVSGYHDSQAPNGRYIDTYNQNYAHYYLLSGNTNALGALENHEVFDFMRDRNWTHVTGKGLYERLCVPWNLNKAVLQGFKVYAMTDLVLKPWHDMSNDPQSATYHPDIVQTTSDTVLKLAMNT